MKAAYDPRISGVYLHIEPLGCGWGKVEEIRRHILDFRKSGKNSSLYFYEMMKFKKGSCACHLIISITYLGKRKRMTFGYVCLLKACKG